MKCTNKAACVIGIFTVVCGISSTAQAQSCAEPSHTPVSKERLDQIGDNQGISNVAGAFENFALATIRPGELIPRNGRTIPSRVREDATHGKYKGVKPDGILPLRVEIFPRPPQSYADSVFYEAKAIKKTSIGRGYQDYQILGFFDVLSRSPARLLAGETPAIIFLTTGNVRIGRSTILQAIFNRVGVLHAIACEIPAPINNNNLQFGRAELLNPLIYLFPPRIPEFIGPGSPGRLLEED